MKKVAVLLSFFLFLSASYSKKPVFYFFHSHTCPHCVHAEPFIESMIKKYPDVKFMKLEISRNLENKELLIKKVNEYKIENPGIPLFIFGKTYIMGYKKETHDKSIEDMIKKEIGKKEIATPN